MTLKEIMFHHKEIRDNPENRKKFNGFFHLNLFDYVDMLTGFNLMKFDHTLFAKHPNYDTMSTKNMLEQEYGQEAADFIKYLLNQHINPFNKEWNGQEQSVN